MELARQKFGTSLIPFQSTNYGTRTMRNRLDLFAWIRFAKWRNVIEFHSVEFHGIKRT